MNYRQAIDDGQISSLQIGVIIVCFILNILDGFDVVAISYAAPSISDDWNVDAQTLGVIFSAGLVGMTLGAMFLAPVTDVIGRRKMILIALAINAVSLAATLIAANVWHLIAARLLTGLSVGSILASLTALVAEYTPARRRNFSIGLLQCGYPIGATGGGFIAAALIPVHGWQSIFLAGLVITLSMIPIVFFALPESLDFLSNSRPKQALETMNRTLQRMGLSRLEQFEPHKPGNIAKASVRSLLTERHRAPTLFLWLAFFMCFFTLYFLLSWIPKILVEAGFSMEQGIDAGIAFNAGAILGVLALGYLADKKGIRELIAIFLIIGGAFMIGFGLAPTEIIILIMLSFLIGSFVDGGFAGLYAVAARLYPTEIRTTGVGWAIGAGRFGGVAGPYVGGLVVAAGWPLIWSFGLFAIPLIIGAIAVMAIKPEKLAL